MAAALWKRKSKQAAKGVEMFKSHVTGIMKALIHRLADLMAQRLNGKFRKLNWQEEVIAPVKI